MLKADGLALGKGVLICNTSGGSRSRSQGDHGGQEVRNSAGNTMVIEEFMTGREVSVLILCGWQDDSDPMTSAQDHKRAKDGDQGLNYRRNGKLFHRARSIQRKWMSSVRSIHLPGNGRCDGGRGHDHLQESFSLD